jgi:hypothetical protein
MMKKMLLWIALAGAVTCASAQPRVGISIGIQQPGVYGRINIGDFPQPEVVYAQPLVITQQPYVAQRQPIYLYVPPEHQRDWGHFCGRYGACGQPVYFVREQWVRDRYAHEHPGWDRGRQDDRRHREERSRYEEPRGEQGRATDRHDDHGSRDDRRDDGDRHGR